MRFVLYNGECASYSSVSEVSLIFRRGKNGLYESSMNDKFYELFIPYYLYIVADLQGCGTIVGPSTWFLPRQSASSLPPIFALAALHSSEDLYDCPEGCS